MTSWDLYRYFLYVARSGSFAAAARELSVSQPTVSRKIDQLQTELSVRLLEQDERGARLTPRGKALLSMCEAMEQKAEGIRGLAERASSAQPVCVATTVGLATWLTNHLGDGQDERPPIVLRTGIGLTDVMHFQADIALRMGQPGGDDLFGRKVATVACGIYSAADAAGRIRTADDLHTFPLIESTEEIAQIPQAEALRKLMGRPEATLTVDNVRVQIAAVEAGHGIAAFPCFMVTGRRRIRRVLRAEFDLNVDLWLLLHPSLKEQSRVRQVYQMILDAVKRDKDLFEGRRKA